jgi:hypothetical protein
MLDARFDVGEHGELAAHTLVDTITSASAASGAAGSAFSENRYEVGAAYLQRFLDSFGAGGGLRYSQEPDYRSFFVTVNGTAELGQRNTTLAFTVARGHDRVTNANTHNPIAAPIVGYLDTTLASFGVTQVLTPLWLAALTYDFMDLNGFQENPYRVVSAGGMLVPERVPKVRLRHAIAASARTYLPTSRTEFLGSYRFYTDNWGVIGHTPELRVIQEITRDLFAQVRYRYYQQNGAFFFQPVYDTNDPAIDPYLTDDPKLAPMTTHILGGKVELALAAVGFQGFSGRVRTELLVEYLFQDDRFGNAVHAELAITVPFEY